MIMITIIMINLVLAQYMGSLQSWLDPASMKTLVS